MLDYLSIQLPGPLAYFPFICRLIAFLLFAPVGLCIILDVIAYGIARTLHLSITQRRVPRSPPVISKEILTNDLISSAEVSEEESVSDN
ncbi:uncharacterized protein IL334_006396 [Kwoniella shivajii]|uniref:Uncharacterized protein n=1 Tax=Kwoniella shivajii TaxID=564305 RepID=A0ABZ1D7Q8_9TREE|nr:hypothetical protein IL334_006396 [Kwoniella shivajii]